MTRRPFIRTASIALFAATLMAAGTARADTVVYSCSNGNGFNATFDNVADNVTVELQNGTKLVLSPAVSGSGFRFTGAGYEFQGKGKQAIFTVPGQPETSCREIGRISANPPQAQPRPQPPAHPGPSFNCNARLNPTEARICANPSLAELDRKMADTYNWLFTQIPAHKHGELRNDQVNWLPQRNRCGSNDNCIQSEILDRTAYLNEYIEPGTPPAPPQTGGVSFPFPAQSWGGIVRSGPGQQYGKVTSLREGERITILEQTGQYFQDRPWFRIRYRGRVGYHWGGIICPKGQPVPGTYQVC